MYLQTWFYRIAQFSIVLGLLGFPLNTWAFPKANLVPGGIAILQLSPVNTPRPQVRFQNQPVTVVPQQQYWVAVVGLGLDMDAGSYPVQVFYPTQGNWQTFPLQIHGKTYKTQRIRIKDKNKVNPDDASSARILSEIPITNRLKNTFSPPLPNLNFIRPTPGRDSGRFGFRRIINNQPRSPHSGMDIAAGTGTPIKATQIGRVIFNGNLFFTGNTVYIDHGQGVISLYAHLSQSLVQNGQVVQQGQIIGKVGKTGRATGPHLHWSIYLNGNSVDPALFLP